MSDRREPGDAGARRAGQGLRHLPRAIERHGAVRAAVWSSVPQRLRAGLGRAEARGGVLSLLPG